MATVTVGTEPGSLDINVYRGDKVGPLQFTPTAPVDLSGYTWLAQIRATKDEPATVVATFTVDASGASTGVIALTLPHAQSALLATTDGRATYFYDVQATNVSDATDVKTWFAGKIKVTGDVSFS
jgi:hypothetical protein